MAVKQTMTQAISQAAVDTIKAVILAVREVDTPVNNAKLVHAALRSGSLALCKPTFNWKVADKCQEVCDFEIEVNNIFMTNN